MSKNNVAIIEAYYKAVGEKNVEGIDKYLHSDVQFIAPLAKMVGKEAVLEATKKFTSLFKTLKIRAKCGSQDQAMVVYDLDCSAPIGNLSAAVLMTFQEGLIIKIELFYDARPFEKKRMKSALGSASMVFSIFYMRRHFSEELYQLS